MNDSYDPELDDRDRALAARLADGRLADSSASTVADDSSLIEALEGLRQDYLMEAARPDDAASRRMAAGLEHAIREAAIGDPTPRRGWSAISSWFIPRRPVWAVALAALVVAVGVLVLVPREVESQVVAQSFAEPVVYTAADGSTVTLRPHSVLSAIGEEEGRSYRIEGEGLFDVAHDESRPFTVEAGEGRITVLGTRFTARTWGGAPQVYLERGKVRFDGPVAGTGVVLEPGESSSLEGGTPTEPGITDGEAALDWLQGALVLASDPLAVVASEMEQHYAISLELPAGVAQERISGRILLGDVERTLADLGMVMGGVFVPMGNDTYRFQSD